MPVVSVIVPIYNAEQYLADCIESIVHQTLSDIEIILVNDGSIDESNKLCMRYKELDSRIIYIEQSNQGVSVARNAGKNKSSGEYIIFVDADDELHPQMLEKLYCDAKGYNADISVCQIQRIQSKNEIVTGLEGKVSVMDNNAALKSYMTESKLEIGVWNKLFKKSAIENIDFCIGRKMNEDKFFAFEGIMNAEVVTYRNEGLYFYYVRNNSVTKQKFDKKWFDNVFFCEKIYEIIIKNKPELEAAARYQMVMTKYYLVLTMKRNHAEHSYSNEYHDLIQDIKKLDIRDLNIKKRPKMGILMIKYCRFIFEAFKSIQK